MKRVFWVLIATMMLAAGCAKAPVEDITAQKNMEQLVEIALTNQPEQQTVSSQAASGAQADADKPRYTADFTDGSGKLRIHADMRTSFPRRKADRTTSGNG